MKRVENFSEFPHLANTYHAHRLAPRRVAMWTVPEPGWALRFWFSEQQQVL